MHIYIRHQQVQRFARANENKKRKLKHKKNRRINKKKHKANSFFYLTGVI